jgi:hypothetical protein
MKKDPTDTANVRPSLEIEVCSGPLPERSLARFCAADPSGTSCCLSDADTGIFLKNDAYEFH